MGEHYRIQCELPRSTGLPEDKVVNTFYFEGDFSAATEAAALVCIGRLKTFYGAVAQYLSTLVTGVVNFKAYDLEQSEPRAPIATDTVTLTGLQTADFPAEIAVCCSFQGTPASGENQRRRRGRIYLGPTNSTTRGAIVGGDVTVLASARTNITAAMNTMADQQSPKWAVFSPTEAGPPLGTNGAYTANQLGEAFNDVTNGWVDDRYDIQRRRGAKATTRTTFT